MVRPIGVDLFAGVGGFSLGFEQAGFDVCAAVEIDPVHAAAHEFNFPNCKVIAKSVVGLSAAEIRDKAGIGHQTVDVVFGGAPCQGFSMIGHRVLDDPRNALVKEFVRLVAELDASYFVFENVKGLTVGNHRAVLFEMIAELETRGYSVVSPWKVLNSVNFRVPQDRERVILIGAKKGLPLPSYPQPFTRAAGTPPTLEGLAEGPSVRDALADIPDAESYGALLTTDSVAVDWWGVTSDYAKDMRCLTPLSWCFGYPRKWNPKVLSASMRTEHSEISRRRFSETAAGTVEPISRFFKLPVVGVANTLRAGTDSARGAFTSPRPIHYLHPRCITVREMARLHGFPDWFRFHETKWHGARQIGNAVAPPLARAIAAQLVLVMDLFPQRPRKPIALGDPKLLSMGMAEAAAYFGIPVPIGGRDRKSGAKKRKQADIEAERRKAA